MFGNISPAVYVAVGIVAVLFFVFMFSIATAPYEPESKYPARDPRDGGEK